MRHSHPSLWLIVALAYAPAAWGGQAAAERQPAPLAEARGPLVEITPREGKPYSGVLLSMKEGALACQLSSGEVKEQKTGDVRSVRFLPPPAPKPENTEEGFNEKDLVQYGHLLRKDREGELTKAEVEEFFKLRERLPLLMQLGKFKGVAAHETAQHEAVKGRLDRYISLVQGKLKHAQTEETVRAAVLMLMPAYRQKDLNYWESSAKLRQDLEAIEDPRLRETISGKITEILDARPPKPDKDRRKN